MWILVLLMLATFPVHSQEESVGNSMLLSGMGSYKCGKKIPKNIFRIAVIYEEPPTKEDVKVLKSIKDLAMETIKNMKKKGKLAGLKKHTFEIFFSGIRSSQGVSSIIKTFFYYILDEPVHGFIGPDEIIPLGTIARMSGSRFNRSLISMGDAGFQNEFRNKVEYQGMTRIAGSHESLLRFVEHCLRVNNWTSIGILYLNDGMYNNYFYVAKELMVQTRSGGYKVDMSNVEDVKYKLNLLSKLCRVILMSGSTENVRKTLLQTSHIEGEISEYVFIHIDLFGKFDERPWIDPKSSENSKKLRRIFRQVLYITLPFTGKYWSSKLAYSLRRIARKKHNFVFPKEKLNFIATSFYESFILYALALNDTLAKGDSLAYITNYMWNRTFFGFNELVNINSNGTRKSDFALFDLNKENGKMEQVGFYNGSLDSYSLSRPIDWGSKNNIPPPNEPACGYEGEKCKKNKTSLVLILVICFVVLLVIALVGGLFGYRYIKFQAELKMMNWQIPWSALDTYEKRMNRRTSTIPEPSVGFVMNAKRINKRTSKQIENVDEVKMGDLTPASTRSRKTTLKNNTMEKLKLLNPKKEVSSNDSEEKKNSICEEASQNPIEDNISLGSQDETTKLPGTGDTPKVKTAIYKDCIVALKSMSHLKKIDATKDLLLEIKKVKDLTSDHICRLVGLCVDPGHLYMVYDYCPKGSLEDVLQNDQINLDWMFRYSLIQDIVRGMIYLHANYGPHGRLKSTNCVVDSRFVLKLTDFGLHSLRNRTQLIDVKGDEEEDLFYKDQLWTSPEVLRQQYEGGTAGGGAADNVGGSKSSHYNTVKNDVYSFAIIVQEIIYRKGVYYTADGSVVPRPNNYKMMVKQIMNSEGVFRPTMESDVDPAMPTGLVKIVTDSWAEDPGTRPDFTTIRNTMRKWTKGKESGNILDNLLSRMEQYANNLEGLVAQRTQEYLEEKKKAENLLYSMLPRSVAHQLIKNQSVSAEMYDQVTIYFSDIVGFTSLSADSTPMQVIELLNRLYTTFDSIIENYDVYKVETIGDAYMVVSGLPTLNGNLHAREIARMSLSFLSAIFKFVIPHRPDVQLKLRIGIHSGFVCAGVVGLKMPRYCLFGDTVNTASRMESNGLPLKIHISETTKNVLCTFGTFIITERGYVEMKGKGAQLTFWLHGENEVIIDPVPEDSKFV